MENQKDEKLAELVKKVGEAWTKLGDYLGETGNESVTAFCVIMDKDNDNNGIGFMRGTPRRYSEMFEAALGNLGSDMTISIANALSHIENRHKFHNPFEGALGKMMEEKAAQSGLRVTKKAEA